MLESFFKRMKNFSSFLTFNFLFPTEYVASLESVINALTDKKVTLVVQVCLYEKENFFYKTPMLFKLIFKTNLSPSTHSHQ